MKKSILNNLKRRLGKEVKDSLEEKKKEQYIVSGIYLVKPEMINDWIKFVESALEGKKYNDRYYVMKGDLRSEVILEIVIDGLKMLDMGYEFDEVDKMIRMYSQMEELMFIRRSLVKFSLLGSEYLSYLSGNVKSKAKVKRII